MGTANLGTGSPPEVPRNVASNAQRWCVEIDGRPRRLASWTEPGLQALSWHFLVVVGVVAERPNEFDQLVTGILLRADRII